MGGLSLKTRKVHLILLPLGAILFLSLFLEVGLRLWDVFSGRSFFQTTGNELEEPLDPVVPFRGFGFDPYPGESDEFIYDRWERRFPREKGDDVFRIVCFGGSTTQNRTAEQNYPTLLEQELRSRAGNDRWEVINVGNSAYATPHALILLALDVSSWDPDLVILSHNVNDLLAIYWPDFRRDYWNKYQDPFYAYPDYSGRYSWSNVLFQHSRLYWFLRHQIFKLRWKLEVWFPDLSRASIDDALLSRGAEVFERNLRSFCALADSYGFPVLIGTQPLQPSENAFLVHMVHKEYNDRVAYPPQAEFVAHHRRYNDVLRKVAAETSAELVDNDRIFGGDPSLFRDFVHYSDAGLAKLVENYAAVVTERVKVSER